MPVDDAFTVSLLHMDGADAGTTFTDESGKTWTAAGNAQIDTAQSKFGGASALFDGTGDYIDTPDHADFDVGSGDFTIDFWVRLNATGARQVITGQLDAAGADSSISFGVEITAANKPQGHIVSGSTYYSTGLGATTLSTGTWYHVALVRSGNTMYMFLDGVQQGTVDVTGITANNASVKLSIGRWGEYNGGFFLNGWVDEFRFSKGVARWTANFTPPAQAYGVDSGGILFF